MATTRDIVARLWSLCDILRDDGITYHQYVTELTLLLFLKMAKEAGQEDSLPKGLRWDDLKAKNGIAQYDFYKQMLISLGRAPDRRVSAIYASAQTALRQPKHLEQLVDNIDALDWFSAREDGLGNLYEGLLEKNASEVKSGAGQYFTPRALINCMVALVQPQPGETIQDPAAGTGGFLVAAHEYIKSKTQDLFELGEKASAWQTENAYLGVELVPETQRLSLMNCMLHGIEGVRGSEGAIQLGDALSSLGAGMPRVDVILTNPPFGTKKGGGRATRDDITYPTGNKQLVFLQHIYRGLKPGGRAAVVLPDNVLFEDGVGQKVRTDLMDKCDLHTILRLPTGIFYAQGVKTNVLFFTRGEKDTGNTKAVWVYDLRANMPSFGKRTPFTREALKPFEDAYGTNSHGKSKRKDEGETGRFRKFTRDEITKRDDNLDIAWMKDDSHHDPSDLPDPEEISAEIEVELQDALNEIQAFKEMLTGDRTSNVGLVGEVSELPGSWQLARLADLGFWRGGSTPSKSRIDYWSGVIPWVSPKDMKVDVILDSEDHITQTALDESSLALLPVAAVLIVTRSGILEHTLPVAITGKPVTINQDIKAVVPSRWIDSNYLAYILRANADRILADCSKAGTTVASIDSDRLLEFEVAVAPLAEQVRIVAKLDALFARSLAVRKSLERLLANQAQKQLSKLAKLERSIWAQAFRGELVPQDPNDEPASVLLERIRAEREASAPVKAKRGARFPAKTRTPKATP